MRALAAVLLVTACTSRTPPPASESSAAETAAPSKASSPPAEAASAPAEAVDPGAPAVVVDGQAVDHGTFELHVQRALHPYRSAGRKLDEAFETRVRRNVLRALIEQEVLRQKAEALKIEPSDAAKKEAWKRAMKRFASTEAAEAFASQMGTTLEAMRAETERLLRRQAIEAYIAEGVEVTDAEVKRYYQERKQHFSRPKRIRYSQLFFRVPPGSKQAEVGARVDARQAMSRLEAGEAFEAIAGDREQAPQNGDQGFREEGQIPGPVAEALDGLRQGRHSDVIKSEFGLHIVKKTGVKPGGPIPLSEVRDDIRRRMSEQRRRAALRESLLEWKSKADISIPADPDYDLKAAIGPAGSLMLPAEKTSAEIPQ